jgi:transposase
MPGGSSATSGQSRRPPERPVSFCDNGMSQQRTFFSAEQFFGNDSTSVLVSPDMSADVAVATPVPPANPIPAALPPLPDDLAACQALIVELLAALKQSQHECDGLRHRLDQLLRRLYGPKAERFDPNQPWLLPELAVPAEPAPPAPAPDAATEPKPKRPGHGRKPLSPNLPRRRLEHTLPEAQRLCPCCGTVCAKFGEEISEQLDYQPASLFVWQHVRSKYACTQCHDHVTVTPPPVAVIAKGLPGPGLLAQIAASKYADHLPLHRLERILGRHGIDLARSTMCSWMAEVADRFRPVVALMADLLRQSKMLHTDATKMPYLEEAVPGKTVSGQMWAYVGDRDHPFHVFDFCRDHSAAGIDAFLRDRSYRGYLNADALNVYDHLFRSGSIVELGCWAHCRRKFYEARDSDPARAHLVLARIRQLYEVESAAKKIIAAGQQIGSAADAVRRQLRQEQALPVMTALRHWLETEQPQVLPKSPLGQAIAYALRHWQALIRYLDDGFLDIDNNVAELTLRHIAIGRKNWLFAGSRKGAETAAILFSVTSSCHRHGVDAFAYLQDLLQRLAHDPQPSPEVLRGWLPDRWQPPPAPPHDGS